MLLSYFYSLKNQKSPGGPQDMQIKGGSWNWHFLEQLQQLGTLQAKHSERIEAALPNWRTPGESSLREKSPLFLGPLSSSKRTGGWFAFNVNNWFFFHKDWRLKKILWQAHCNLVCPRAVEVLVINMQGMMTWLRLSGWVQIGLGCFLREECLPPTPLSPCSPTHRREFMKTSTMSHFSVLQSLLYVDLAPGSENAHLARKDKVEGGQWRKLAPWSRTGQPGQGLI